MIWHSEEKLDFDSTDTRFERIAAASGADFMLHPTVMGGERNKR
jgi:hypothetical protein